jgi:hypothetical protein
LESGGYYFIFLGKALSHSEFCPLKKIISRTFQISGTLIVNIPQVKNKAITD